MQVLMKASAVVELAKTARAKWLARWNDERRDWILKESQKTQGPFFDKVPIGTDAATAKFDEDKPYGWWASTEGYFTCERLIKNCSIEGIKVVLMNEEEMAALNNWETGE